MKSALIIITLATWSSGQLIYPDQFESMLAASAGPQRLESSVTPTANIILNDGYNRFPGQNLIPSQAPPGRGFQQDPTVNFQTSNAISQGVLRFALNMDEAVSVARSRSVPGSRENVVFSPLSVAATLALVLLGSAGKTFEEVSTILGFDRGLDISRNSEAVHQMFGQLISAIGSGAGLPGLPETTFANGLFVQDGYPIRSEFKAAGEQIYNSEVINVDYQNSGTRAQKVLNDWVKNQTRGKIPSILGEQPPAETRVIIASALYFNGEWNQHFIDGATRRKPFTIAPGETVNVDMMYNGGEFPFFEDKQLRAKIVGLPYKGHEVTMYVVLPTDQGVEALRALERRLIPETLENLIGNMENKSCIIGLPKMKLSSTLNLGEALRSLGLYSLFDPATADLSILSSGYTGQRFQPFVTPTPPPRTIDTFTFGNRINAEAPRVNFFSYDDKVRGYHVEQWASGFSISTISRNQRRRRSLNALALRVERSAASDAEEERFESKEAKASGAKRLRSRRQAIPNINKNFLNVVGNRNQASYGIDNLRNNGLLTNPRLYADSVLHRVEIEVSEVGTVAAAATAVIITKDGNQKRLVADHPFLFFIRHEPTGLILFWASVNEPTPSDRVPTKKR